MHIVELHIRHRGCWGSEIGIRFPGCAFSSIDCRWVGGEVAHLLHARGGKKELSRIARYLRGRGDVSKVERLSEGEDSLHLRVLTRRTHAGQFSDLFFAHHCFPVAPTRFVEDREVWTLGCASRAGITRVYEALRKRHPVTIASLSEKEFGEGLTQKQREALGYAKLLGYYEWPRKASATEICRLVGIPKTVFLSHLRKAERKIVAAYAERTQE